MYGKRLSRKPQKGSLEVRDRVRLKKGYLPGWTEEVFFVRRVIPGVVTTYKIEELDRAPLKGTFYEQDLQKVTIWNNDSFRVEKC